MISTATTASRARTTLHVGGPVGERRRPGDAPRQIGRRRGRRPRRDRRRRAAAKARHAGQRARWASSSRSSIAERPRRRRGPRWPRASARTSWWSRSPRIPGVPGIAGRVRPRRPAAAVRRRPPPRATTCAVAELVRQTQPAVWQVCASLGSAGEVEDLVQETYLRALRALPRYRGEAPVRVWLLSIARRMCADHVRRRQRQRRLLDRLTIEAARHGDVAGRRRPRSATTPAAPARSRPPRGVRPDPARRAQLRGGGDVVGCPIGTIRSRVARARADLRCGTDATADVAPAEDRAGAAHRCWNDARMVCSAVSSSVGSWISRYSVAELSAG